MRTYDISLTLSNDMPTWPGDPKIDLQRISKIEDGATANVTAMSASLHTGTHVDAPYHFLGGDAATVDALLLTATGLVMGWWNCGRRWPRGLQGVWDGGHSLPFIPMAGMAHRSGFTVAPGWT